MHQHNHSHIKDDSDNRIAMAFFLDVRVHDRVLP